MSSKFGGKTALGFAKGGGGGSQTNPTDMWGGISNAFTGNASAKEASKKAFQRNLYMSNTAYQRAVKDMIAAGLNPMLAYSQGGASTPSTAASEVRPIGGELVKAYTGLMGAKNQSQVAEAQSENLRANTAQAAANAANTDMDTKQRELQYEKDAQTNPEAVKQAQATTQKLQGDLQVLEQTIKAATASAQSAQQVANNQKLLFPLQRQAIALGNRAAGLKMTQAELDQRIAKFKLDMVDGMGKNNRSNGELLDKVGAAIRQGYDSAKSAVSGAYDKVKSFSPTNPIFKHGKQK